MSSIEQLHRDGDCGFDCPACAEDALHESTHTLNKERECERCGMSDYDNEIRDNDCIDESLTVVARPGLEVDHCYVNPDGSAFFTPDGIGCIFYVSEEALLADAGEEYEVVYLDRRFEQ